MVVLCLRKSQRIGSGFDFFFSGFAEQMHEFLLLVWLHSSSFSVTNDLRNCLMLEATSFVKRVEMERAVNQ